MPASSSQSKASAVNLSKTFCLGQDLFKNMQQYDLDLQMTLAINIVLKQLYHFALTFWISVIMLSLVHGFTLYSHTMLLRSSPFHQHVASCPWPLDDLDIQHSSLTICVKVLFFSYKHLISWHIYCLVLVSSRNGF